MGVFELRYSVQRRELWQYYWWAWRQPDGLWIYWLIFALAAFLIGWLLALTGLGISPVDTTTALCIAGICFFVAFPQLAYKPQERTLTVSANGIDTAIGTRSAHRGWADISSVVSQDGRIILMVANGIRLLPRLWLRTRVGNAFIVPNRAFSGIDQQQAFLSDVQAWRGMHAKKLPTLATRRYFD